MKSPYYMPAFAFIIRSYADSLEACDILPGLALSGMAGAWWFCAWLPRPMLPNGFYTIDLRMSGGCMRIYYEKHPCCCVEELLEFAFEFEADVCWTILNLFITTSKMSNSLTLRSPRSSSFFWYAAFWSEAPAPVAVCLDVAGLLSSSSISSRKLLPPSCSLIILSV